MDKQIHLNAAKAHFAKLSEFLGTITVNGVLKMTDLEFKECQISKQKTTYLRAVSTAINNGLNFETLSILEDNEVRKKLLPIKGIGQWTIDMYLMQCHQSKNIIPLGDVTIRTTIKDLYGNPDKENINKLIRLWSPHCSLVTFFLWHYYLKKRNRTY